MLLSAVARSPLAAKQLLPVGLAARVAPRGPSRLRVPSAMAEQRGHQAPATQGPAPPVDPAVQRLREHQSAAARQPFAEECRTLLRLSRYGVLSSLSVAKESEGFPSGAVVGYADELASGAPIFVFSTMSGHTRDVLADGRASLTVTAPGFQGAADARVCLTGRLTRVAEAELPAARERYMAVHPEAFWAAFGDFSYFVLRDIVAIRLVGGFARAGSIPPALYAAAQPDPVAGACAPLLAMANAYGEPAWAGVVGAQIGGEFRVDGATVRALRLGLGLRDTTTDAPTFPSRSPVWTAWA